MRSRSLVTLLTAAALFLTPAASALAMDPLHLLAQVNHLASQDDEPTTCPAGTALYQGKCVNITPPPKKPAGQKLVLGTATAFTTPSGSAFQSF